jgi:hypothetical protein
MASRLGSLLPVIAASFSCLGTAGCVTEPVPKPPPPPLGEQVARHFVVLVREPDRSQPTNAAPGLAEHAVLGGSLPTSAASETVFELRDLRYRIEAARRKECLFLHVARHGMASLPDFDVSGCVPVEGSEATLATARAPDGSPIEVAVWFFAEPGPARSITSR